MSGQLMLETTRIIIKLLPFGGKLINALNKSSIKEFIKHIFISKWQVKECKFPSPVLLTNAY